MLKDRFAKRVIGPEFPLINKMQNYFLKTILIKFERVKELGKWKKEVLQIVFQLQAKQNYRSVQVNIDVDPM